PRHTATTGAGPTSTHSGPGAILPTCGLAQPLEYLLSSLSAQQDLDDCAIGLATIDLSASAPLCQSPVFRFSQYATHCLTYGAGQAGLPSAGVCAACLGLLSFYASTIQAN